MALSPFQNPQDRVRQLTPRERPTRTYKLDFDKGAVGGTIEGKDALKQFVHKAVITARFRFPIYDDQYGCELEDLIGQDIPFELFETEVRRVIREALIYDERINDVRDFNIRKEDDKVFIEFTVDSIYGEISEGVSV